MKLINEGRRGERGRSRESFEGEYQGERDREGGGGEGRECKKKNHTLAVF